MWALFVITLLADIDDAKYTMIQRFDTRWSCEITKDLFIAKYGPFEENEEVVCLKADE